MDEEDIYYQQIWEQEQQLYAQMCEARQWMTEEEFYLEFYDFDPIAMGM